jgi:hypothetical protein
LPGFCRIESGSGECGDSGDSGGMPLMCPPLNTEVHFASFFSGGFTTMAVINPPEKKLTKCTSVHCGGLACQKMAVAALNVIRVKSFAWKMIVTNGHLNKI